MTIDWWTLGIQAANVLILVWLLARFLYRPVMDIIARRQAEAGKLLTEVEDARKAAEAAMAEATAERRKTIAEREQVMATAAGEAARRREDILAEAAAEAGRVRASGQAALARDRQNADAALVQRAGALAAEIAARLVARLPPDVVLAGFLSGLDRELGALPPEVVSAMAGQAREGVPLEVVSASPLPEEASASLRSRMEALLGREAVLRFSVDPGLIGGFEIVSPVAAIHNSWKADLNHIAAELATHARPV